MLARNQVKFAAFVKLEKAFDRNILFYKLFRYNIDHNIYWAIKLLHKDTVDSVSLSNLVTE